MQLNSDHIEKYLGPDGCLSKNIKGFENRSSQVKMAETIMQAIHNDLPAIIEAGTGTGKTFGYLIPLILSKKKSVISTSSKTLQEQIFYKDIPILTKALGINIDVLIMKGRKNYLCLHRYNQSVSGSFAKREISIHKAKLNKWLKKTKFADRSELSWLNDGDPIWDSISSTSEQCLGAKCVHYKDCYLNTLRKEANKSQLIIVNHHLFFADLMVKKEGYNAIFPHFEVAVFDEAHNIEEIATTYFGKRLSTRQLIDLADEVDKEIKKNELLESDSLKTALIDLRVEAENIKYIFNSLDVKGWLSKEIVENIKKIVGEKIKHCLKTIQETEKIPSHFILRTEKIINLFENILSSDDSNICAWYEKRKKSIVLYTSPLDITENMRELLYNDAGALIFTSATLSTNGNFKYIRSRLGVPENALEGIYPSHFLFDKQTVMYIAKDLPLPSDPNFSDKISQRIIDILKISSGRALVLFTSYYNMNKTYQSIMGKIPYTIFKQGDIPKLILLEKFKKDTHSVLLATKSFWQGVDFPGETLTSLIIDKLPFDSPGEPLVASRINSIKECKGNPFFEYQLPSAIISLKQGLGRLIRKSNDIGVLSILDKRMKTAPYHKVIIRSLPNIPLIYDLSKMETFLKSFPSEKSE